MKRLKTFLRNNFHGVWDVASAYRWQLKWLIPPLYPQIYKAVAALSRDDINKVAETGKRVLFFAVRQDRIHTAWEFVLAQALRLRGHKVDYIACDGLLRTCCNERWYPELKKPVCRACHLYAREFYSNASFGVSWLSQYYKPEDSAEAEKVVSNLDFDSYRSLFYEGLPLGELVRPSVCHFTRTENIEAFGKNDAVIRRIYKDFLAGAVMMVRVCHRILEKHKPEKIVLLNGHFMAERVMLELARKRGVDTFAIESGLRPETIVVIRNSYIDYSKVEGWEHKKDMPLTDDQEAVLNTYMQRRISGGGQTMAYWTDSVTNKEKISAELGLKGYKSVSVLFPNVTWDSALYGLEVMFKTLQELIEKTIEYYSTHPEACLIIRTHPADKTWHGGMRDSIYNWINSRYEGKLPKNVIVVGPDSSISSYSVMEMADFGIVFSSTTGLEMTLIGKPVIVVGKVHYWGHGFTVDPMSEREYYQTLDRFISGGIQPDKDANKKLARRYAYFIFYEASIPITSVNSYGYRLAPPELALKSYSELMPGKNRPIDIVCDGIVSGTKIVQ